jgi:hypothetical protein
MIKMILKMISPVTKLARKALVSKNLNILVQMLLILYSAILVPRLPTIAIKLFNNTFVKVILMSMIAIVATKDMKTALMMSVALIVTLNYIMKLKSVGSVSGLLNAAVDAPQEVLNKLTDDAQEIKNIGIEEVGDLVKPIKPILNAANNLINTAVDTVQDTANKVIDQTQSAIIGNLEPYTNDVMDTVGKI